jgi:hypothetical protein
MIKYKVKARIAKRIGEDDFEIEDFEQTFTDPTSPILARKSAFNYYSSVLDVIGVQDNSFNSLKEYIDNQPKKEVEIADIKYQLPIFHALGVGIYIEVDKTLAENSNFESNEDNLIIGFISGFDYLSVAFHLETEMKLYADNDWDTQGWNTQIKYWDYEAADEGEEEIITSEVLSTPFDFWEYHNPSKISSPKKVESVKGLTELEKIIQAGENNKVEFKSTLRYCKKEKNHQEYIEYAAVKTLASLANTNGGILLVGVEDSGNIFGLDKDIETFKEQSNDQFLKHFDNIISKYFTSSVDALIHGQIENVNDKSIFFVQVKMSSRPIFTKLKNEVEFYIRRSASSPKLDVEESVIYIRDKWGSSW